MRSRSVEERLAVLQGFVDRVAELTRASPATDFRGALSDVLARSLEESVKE